RAARRTNRIERVQISRAEVTEAWQESGQDWVTVYFAVSLIDYTVDDSTGAVVEGADTPGDIQEYWTFTRPVGPKPLRLSAIQSAQSSREVRVEARLEVARHRRRRCRRAGDRGRDRAAEADRHAEGPGVDRQQRGAGRRAAREVAVAIRRLVPAAVDRAA